MIFRRFFKRKTKICAICRQQIKKKQKTKRCRRKHTFHREHLLEWLKVHDQCPTCKGKIEPETDPLQGLTPEDWDKLNLTPQVQQEGILQGTLVGETRGSFQAEIDPEELNKFVSSDVKLIKDGSPDADHVIGLVRSYDKETGIAAIQTHGVAEIDVGATDDMSKGVVDVVSPALQKLNEKNSDIVDAMVKSGAMTTDEVRARYELPPKEEVTHHER